MAKFQTILIITAIIPTLANSLMKFLGPIEKGYSTYLLSSPNSATRLTFGKELIIEVFRIVLSGQLSHTDSYISRHEPTTDHTSF